MNALTQTFPKPTKRWAVSYRCDTGPEHVGVWHCKAFDAEHAEEKFYDSDDGEAGWIVTGVKRADR